MVEIDIGRFFLCCKIYYFSGQFLGRVYKLAKYRWNTLTNEYKDRILFNDIGICITRVGEREPTWQQWSSRFPFKGTIDSLILIDETGIKLKILGMSFSEYKIMFLDFFFLLKYDNISKVLFIKSFLKIDDNSLKTLGICCEVNFSFKIIMRTSASERRKVLLSIKLLVDVMLLTTRLSLLIRFIFVT